MPVFLGERQSVCWEGNRFTAGIGNLKHELWRTDTPDSNPAFLLREETAGVYGIFKRVCNDNRKLPRIDRQRIRKLQPCLQRNSRLLCLCEIGGERRVDDNILTIPYRCVRLELADGLTDIVKCIRRFSFLQQGCSRAKDMACIMSVNTGFFRRDCIRRKLIL